MGENTPIPETVPRETTDRLSRDLHARLAMNIGNAVPVQPEQVIHILAEKVAARIGERTAGGNGNGNGRSFLGLDRPAWARILIGWSVALILAFGGWWLAVRDGLRERPTFDEVKTEIKDTSIDHNGAGDAHPAIQKRINEQMQEQRLIRESQIRQESTDRQQTETLNEIKNDVRRMRRNR